MKKKHHVDTSMVTRRQSKKAKSKRSVKKMSGRKMSVRTHASRISKHIDKYLKTLKSGGGRLEAWQDKYPAAGTSAWKSDNNICKYPTMQKLAFNPPGQRGGSRKRNKKKGGEYHIDESYFGRRPIGYSGPHQSPHPSLKAWKPYSTNIW